VTDNWNSLLAQLDRLNPFIFVKRLIQALFCNKIHKKCIRKPQN
jgi:hypothetical protein